MLHACICTQMLTSCKLCKLTAHGLNTTHFCKNTAAFPINFALNLQGFQKWDFILITSETRFVFWCTSELSILSITCTQKVFCSSSIGKHLGSARLIVEVRALPYHIAHKIMQTIAFWQSANCYGASAHFMLNQPTLDPITSFSARSAVITLRMFCSSTKVDSTGIPF